MKTLLIILLFPTLLLAQPHTIYMMPGFGSDGRVFSRLSLDGADTVTLRYLVPEKNESLPAYAQRMAAQIDTTAPFSLLGVSFGGMVAVEMGKFLHPEHIFLVASAKTRDELPVRYRFQKYLPINRLVSGRFMKKSAPMAARVFEPSMREHLPFFKEMIGAKNDFFMSRTLECIIHWENQTYPANVVHIHGSKDHTLPARRIKAATMLPGGSHWAVFLNAPEISAIINAHLALL